jgi:hypothetical protein
MVKRIGDQADDIERLCRDHDGEWPVNSCIRLPLFPLLAGLGDFQNEDLHSSLTDMNRVLRSATGPGIQRWKTKSRVYHLRKALGHLARIGTVDSEGEKASGVDHGYNAAVRILMATRTT